MSGPTPVTVFAVEPTAVQISWASVWSGPHRLTVGDTAVEVTGAGTHAPVFEGLAPGVTHDITLDGKVVASATTLVPPSGPVLAKVATLSDLHLGERHWGHLPRIRDDRRGLPLPPARCVAAAVEEITAWGPDLLVLKGDLTHNCRRAEFDELGRLVKDLPFPVLALPGNHDGGNHRADDVVACLAEWGLDAVVDLTAVDLPGLRVVAVPTMEAGRGIAGGLTEARLDRLATVLREAPGPALVCTHHQPMRRRVPTYWPPGIVRRDARALLATIAGANPASVVTSGHTHRNRRWSSGPVVVTEVGSVKDYPGTWGGYYVYEGGMVQSVRRVAGRDALDWTDRGRHMLFGIWGRYAPGQLHDRCFVHHWPRRPRSGPPTLE